jgi:hypothetical protein
MRPTYTAKEAYIHSKRGLYTQQKRPSAPQKRPTYTAKEAYTHSKRGLVHSKRGLYTPQKRPTHTAKEAYTHSKRGLYTQQKRLIYTAKEAYVCRPATRARTAESLLHSEASAADLEARANAVYAAAPIECPEIVTLV